MVLSTHVSICCRNLTRQCAALQLEIHPLPAVPAIVPAYFASALDPGLYARQIEVQLQNVAVSVAGFTLSLKTVSCSAFLQSLLR